MAVGGALRQRSVVRTMSMRLAAKGVRNWKPIRSMIDARSTAGFNGIVRQLRLAGRYDV
jgi:hypothetical protein